MMNWHEKNVKRFLFTQMFGGLLFVAVGVILILREKLMWNVSYAAFLVILGYSTLLSAYRYFVNKTKMELIVSIGSAIFFGVLLIHPAIFLEFSAFLFGVWALFKGLTHAFDLYVAIIKKQRGKLAITLEMIFDLFMAGLLIKSGIDNYFLVNLQVGIYVILRGILQIVSTYRIVVRDGYPIRLPAPVILTGFLPLYLIRKIDHDTEDDPSIVEKYVEPTTGNYISLYLYAKDHGYNKMGHVDFGYNGAIYSYGCHDPYDRHKTQAYGAGLLIIGSEVDFVQHSVDNNTTVFRFLCEIDDEQRNEIERQIDLLMKDAYLYEYPHERKGSGEYYIGMLKNEGVRVDYYKFNEGPFKTYNVFTTNCIQVTEYVLRSTGMKLFHMNGIITPGTYYAYLNQNLGQPGSMIVRKDVYRNIESKNYDLKIPK